MNNDNFLSKEQSDELQKLINKITNEAKNVVKDYTKNPSDISGSIIEVHEHSPYLASREERVVSIDGKKLKIKPDKE